MKCLVGPWAKSHDPAGIRNIKSEFGGKMQ